MIQSFSERNGFAQDINNRIQPRHFPSDVTRTAQRKIAQLNAATELRDLRTPPGNQLEALRGNLKGKHSIRINRQWRIVFTWKNDGPHNVEITDYH